MQEKTWYYEKWVGRQASFSPSQYVKALLISVLPEREIREMWESFYQCTGALAAPAAPVPPPLTCNRPQISIMVPYICLTSSTKWRKRTLLKLESQL